MKTHPMYLAGLHTIYMARINYHFVSHKTITGKVEHNSNDWQLLVPFTTMAVQMIIDSHLVREYERTFPPWSIGRFVFKYNALWDIFIILVTFYLVNL
jgi:hypothetical protein